MIGVAMEGEELRARDTVGKHLERLLGAVRAGSLGGDRGPMETLAEPTPLGVDRALASLDGALLGERYELGRLLGAGGMGAVFEGRDLRLERRVAIKVIKPALARDTEYTRRFLREAQAASKIRHRNVVVVLDYGEVVERGLVYSVMELLAGQDLQALLNGQPEQRLPWARACGLLVQIASGLKAAHGEGIIHRDIKPANCFLTQEDGDPVVKLVDFGIAKLEHAEQQLTSRDLLIGTPSYIAPELVRTQEQASPRSDVYSLGVVAYRMLTGNLPFTGETSFEVMRRACMDPVPSLRERVPDLPVEVEALVLEMLAKEPGKRPTDMGVVRERLRTLGRETLGVEAVEIPISSALSLEVDDVEMDGSLEPTEKHTTRPRDAEARTLTHPLVVPRITRTPPIRTWSRRTSTTLIGVALIGALGWAVLSMSTGEAEHTAPKEPVELATTLQEPSAGTESQPESVKVGEDSVRADDTSKDASAVGDDGAPVIEDRESAHPGGEARPPSLAGAVDAVQKREEPRPAKGIPSDAENKRMLERKIRKKCANEMIDDSVTVLFFVSKRGEIGMLTATPKNSAGECAKQQVMGTEFRRRSEDAEFKIVVE